MENYASLCTSNYAINNALEVTGNMRTWQVYKNVHLLKCKDEQVPN